MSATDARRRDRALDLNVIPWPLPDLGAAHRQRLIGTLQRSTERPRRPPGEGLLGPAVLVAMVVLIAVALLLRAAEVADEVRETRAAVERCGR
jgi:hypothetical protein